MSRQSVRSKSSEEAFEAEQNADGGDIIRQAVRLYGTDAATAVALCGLDAWLEGKENEFQQWSEIFRRMRN